MPVLIYEATPEKIAGLRNEFLAQIGCQFVKYSAVERGFTRVFAFGEGKPFGYGVVQTKYDPDAIVEFYCQPDAMVHAGSSFIELLCLAKPKEILAQTNMPLLYGYLKQFSKSTEIRSLLFKDRTQTNLTSRATVRRVTEEDEVFEHRSEPVGSWCAELDGRIVATAGYLTHYNPPYADIFMEVDEPFRRQGIGSYLVQEVMKVARQEGYAPSARCNPDNEASRKTLERAGFEVCGEFVFGQL